MFKLSQPTSFFWPITVEIPKGGKFEKHTFDAEFRLLEVDELNELTERFSGLSSDDEDKSKEAIRQILVGWKGVVDDDGEVPFSETSVEQLLKIPQARVALLRGFRAAMSGEAKRKN